MWLEMDRHYNLSFFGFRRYRKRADRHWRKTPSTKLIGTLRCNGQQKKIRLKITWRRVREVFSGISSGGLYTQKWRRAADRNGWGFRFSRSGAAQPCDLEDRIWTRSRKFCVFRMGVYYNLLWERDDSPVRLRWISGRFGKLARKLARNFSLLVERTRVERTRDLCLWISLWTPKPGRFPVDEQLRSWFSAIERRPNGDFELRRRNLKVANE